MADQSIFQVAAPLTVREKLMAMTDDEFKDYELKLQEAHSKINATEFQKYLQLVPENLSSAQKLIRKTNPNHFKRQPLLDIKAYMPTDAAFREQAIVYDQATSALYKYAIDSFIAHWSLIQELNHEFFQFDLKKKKMELLKKEMKEIAKTSKNCWKKTR
jgi:hypothetical protein